MSLDNLIDGRAIAKEVHAETEARVAALKADGVEPCLVFIRVGEDPASRVYVGMKERTAAKLGIRSETTVLPEDTPEAELLELLEKLNADDSVHGVLVQAPLPGNAASAPSGVANMAAPAVVMLGRLAGPVLVKRGRRRALLRRRLRDAGAQAADEPRQLRLVVRRRHAGRERVRGVPSTKGAL